MRISFFNIILLLLSQLSLITVCSGFVELFAGAGGAIAGYFIATACRWKECCSENGIPANFTGLEEALRRHVYGQHIVEEVVVNALRSHWGSKYKPQKALTISFHGWAGSGKNYVTKFIIENMYKEGMKSNFVHYFVGRTHFPLHSRVPEYQEELYKWIKGNVTKCSKQLFVFDEVDKMPPSVLDAIKPMIDYHEQIDGTDYRDSVFIFLSNTGASEINNHYLELWKRNGKKREDLKLTDFESLISKGAFNEEGGFYHSDNIKSNLIDHYVPFLPMERRHVKLCIIDQFKQRDVDNPEERYIDAAMEFIEWGPYNERVFSLTGCKRISQKVAMIVSKYRLDK